MRFLTTTNTSLLNLAILLVRITSGLILFVAGAMKVFGWFGGFGLKTTLGFFNTMGFSNFWAYISCFTELIGGFLIVVGLFTRPAAFLLTINMAVVLYVLGTKDFFTTGGAYPLLLATSFIAILLTGPMAYSFDALISGNRNTGKEYVL